MSLLNELLPNPEMLRDVQILVVDNDRDSRDLYAFLLESRGATVTTLGSIKAALDFLNWCIPTLLICEMRFLSESVYPLIQQVRHLAVGSGTTIPILITSTCSLTNLAQQLQVTVEAYLLKPVDINDLVIQVWNLTYLSRIA
jgi:CheY-like chemotaxis protein